MDSIKESKYIALKNFICTHEMIFIACHKEPDGDGIAASIGLKRLVEHFGKKATLLCAGPFKRTETIKYKNYFSNKLPFMTQEEIDSAAFIMCDCSEASRVGEIENNQNILFTLDTFIIDHHKTANIGEKIKKNDWYIIDPSAPATALLVQLVAEHFIGKLDSKTAKILFFGTMTDTGFFRFLTQKDFDVLTQIARLLEAGASPRDTYDEITQGRPYNSRKLLGYTLYHSKRYIKGKLVITSETAEQTRLYAKEGRDNDNLYSLLLSVKGVEVVAFIREEAEESCTVGLRSNGNIDISGVAVTLGGGGHKNAAGSQVVGNIESVTQIIVQEVAKILKEEGN